MQRRGLVVREECHEDRRGAFVVLTPAGRRAIEMAAPRHVETVRRLFFDRLTDEQVQTLATISDQILAGLDEDEAAGP
jgi:DNA-binding MarR family transcriptional regulator